MSRTTKFVTAYCGHTSTDEYISNRENFLQCCSKCRKKMSKDEIEAAKKKLEGLRHELAVWCEDCKADVEPLEDAGVLLGVFWGSLKTEKARSLAREAHRRHQHTNYDERRTQLELEGWSSREARNIGRGLDPDRG